jgi:hypothetical protein
VTLELAASATSITFSLEFGASAFSIAADRENHLPMPSVAAEFEASDVQQPKGGVGLVRRRPGPETITPRPQGGVSCVAGGASEEKAQRAGSLVADRWLIEGYETILRRQHQDLPPQARLSPCDAAKANQVRSHGAQR